MRFLNFLVTAAILGGSFSTVQAKSLQKMTTPELIEVVREHSRVSKRLAAIDKLVARRAGNTSSALANRCQEDPNEDVCARIVSGLAEMNHPEARAQLLVILRQVAAPDAQRNQALAELLISDKNLLREAMPSILMNYRSLPPAVGDPIIRALVPLSQKELVDIAIVITKD